MSLVPTTVEPSPVAERPPRTGTRAAWLVAGCYLLGALAVTVHLWADPMAQLMPGRSCLLADGAAGAVLAFSLDRARSLVRRDRGWFKRIPATAAVLAVLPLIPLPYQTDPVSAVPAGWQQAFARLRLAPAARVLVVPGHLAHSEVMHWQAETGEPRSMVGGYFLGPGPNGQATFGMGGPQQYAATYLNRLWSG